MKEAACSWRVSTSSIFERRRDSTTARFSSPGSPKMRWTPSFSSAATSRSEPLLCMDVNLLPHPCPRKRRLARQFAGEDDVARFISQNDDATILIAILALLQGFWKARQLLTEVWTRKSVAALL